MQSIASLKKVILYVALVAIIMALVVATGVPARANGSASDPADPAGTTTNDLFIPLLQKNADWDHPATIFGVQMYGSTSGSNGYLPHIVDSGASWVRVPVHWETAEPVNVSPAEFDWSDTDHAVSLATRAHPQIIATVDVFPAWAAPAQQSPFYEESYDDFAEYIGALVERYDGDGIDDAPGSPEVQYWEFFNEPDAAFDSYHARWGDHGADYARMLESAYGPLKAANPDAQLVFGGIAHDWFEEQGGPFVRSFLEDVLAAGGGDYFDVMNFHVYPSFSSNWTDHGPGLLEKAEVIREKMAEYDVQKPMIISEAGWHSNNPPAFPSSPEIQARYVVELYTQSMAADIDIMIWWMLFDPGGYAWDNGLVTNDSPPQRKPSFHAYQTMVEKMSAAEFVRALSTDETGSERMEAYEFTHDEQGTAITIAWLNPVDTQDTQPLQISAGQATLYDIYGASSTVNDGDDGAVDGQITVQVGGQPVYVEVSQ